MRYEVTYLTHDKIKVKETIMDDSKGYNITDIDTAVATARERMKKLHNERVIMVREVR